MLKRVGLLSVAVAMLVAAAACGGATTTGTVAGTPTGPGQDQVQSTIAVGVGGLGTPTAGASATTAAKANEQAAGVLPAAKESLAAAPAGKLGSYSGAATTQAKPDFTALAGATAHFGTLGKTVYQVEIPDAWNGELVMYAHGFAGFGSEVSVAPPPAALRKALIAEGFAWAASSYSENGYTPGIGADDTLALKQYFAQQFGTPKRTYLAGVSMGGNVVSLSLEHYGDQYDGALAACGALTGEEQIDYLTSWVALAEYSAGIMIPIGDGGTKVGAALLQQIPQALGTPASPTAKGQQFLSGVESLTGGPRPFFVEGMTANYVINFGLLLLDPDRQSLPGRATTNVGVDYHIDGVDDAALNAAIRRFAADPAARDAVAHPDAVPTTGNISKPLLTLHGTGDLFVPISIEQSYLKKVQAAGKADLLVQRAIRSGGHCQFSAEEFTTAFNDLVSWVRDGKKPAGDNLAGDLNDIGRQFTTPLRAGDPGGK
jgi:pimeloyl-ACP methyl ester carboxylesterase